METVIGATMVCLGIYLFWEPSYGGKAIQNDPKSSKSKNSGIIGDALSATIRPGFIPRRGLRIYRAFAFVGALLGFFLAKLLVSFPDLTELIPPTGIMWFCVLLGSFIGYILPRVAENYIVVLGPPIGVVLGYEYLKYERDIDLQEIVAQIPVIPEISHSLFSSFILVSTTFLTLLFRMHLRQILPIIMSGLFSGALIGNGASITQTKSLPLSTAEIELQFSIVIALFSIIIQAYVKFYGREKGMKKQRVKDRERRLIKRAGDIVMLRCPACGESSPHKVEARKETGKGIQLIVNCRGLNQFDELCNNHHTVIETR